MNCEHYATEASAFVDGELSDVLAASFFAHLAECAVCRDTLQQFIRLSVAIARTDDDGTPAHAQSRRPQAHDCAPVPRVAALRGTHLWKHLVLSVALIAAFVAGVLFVRITGNQQVAATPAGLYVITEPVEIQGYYSSLEKR